MCINIMAVVVVVENVSEVFSYYTYVSMEL